MAEEGVSMREILFRGQRLDTGEWVEGFFSSETFYGHTPNGDRVFIIQKGTGFYCPVDPATVGQFTGSVDKAGKRIFEGDIVSFGANVYVIKYIEKYSRFSGTIPGIVFSGFPLANSIVIGSVHDTPDLLEGEQA